MFMQFSGSGAVLVVAALTLGPAILRWWWGRSLARFADDPLIAERLHAHQSRVGLVLVVSLVALFVAVPWWALWALPVLLLMQSVASYPLTRRLYGETWSLAASVSFYTRLPAAVFGFWALLGATPWIISSAGRWEWMAAALLAVVLLAWDRYAVDVVLTALRSEPITDARLLERFAALVAASGIPAPRFEWVRMKGGVLANALALPSLRRSAVLFTDTLVSRLGPDETVAICAHEIAHLEYFDRRRMRRIQFANWFLIAIMCTVTPISRLVWPWQDGVLAASACVVAMGVALALRGRHRQRNETASDMRAVALTGDPDALARALTSLHTIARVPRRWDQKREQQATHPSLARRIRDIHAAAGTVSAGSNEATATFRATHGDAAVSFDKTHVHWQDAPGTIHVIEYGTLSELRLHVSPSGDPSLIAVERQGRRWTMPTRPEDAAALQSMLDTVDGKLADPGGAVPVSAPVTRLVAIFGCTLAVMLGQFALALVAIIATLAPAAAVLKAAAGASFVTAAVLVAHGGDAFETNVAFAIILMLLGGGFLLMAHTRRTDTTQPPPFAVAALAVGAVGATAGIFLGGVDLVRLHQGARDLSAAPVLLVAFAAAAWSSRHRPHGRYVPLTAAVAGLTIVAVGSTVFLERVGRDPFLVHAASLRWAGVEGEPETSFDIPFEIESLRLSPNGHLAAFVRADYDAGSTRGAAPAFHLRRADGSLTVLQGSDLAFLDDRRVLLLALDHGGAEIAIASFDGAPAADWRQRVPGIRAASLTFHRARNEWALIGRDGDGNVVRAVGAVGQVGFRQANWKGLADQGAWVNAIGTRGDAAIALQKNYDYGILGRALAMRLPTALIPTFPESRVWRLGPGARVETGRSLLDVNCGAEARDDEGLVCTAFDGAQTRIVSLEPSTAGVTGLAAIDGLFYAYPSSPRGWLTGWWRGAPAAIHLDTRLGLRLAADAGDFVTVVAPAESVIGTAAPVEGGMRVRLYPLAVAMGALTRAE